MYQCFAGSMRLNRSYLHYAAKLGLDRPAGRAYVCDHRQNGIENGIEMNAKVAYVARGYDVASTDFDGKNSWLRSTVVRRSKQSSLSKGDSVTPVIPSRPRHSGISRRL